MMTVFVDTNILIDLLCERESFVQSARMLFAYGYSGRLTLVLSSLSLVNAVYIARKYGYVDVREKLDDITEFVEVVDLRKEVAKRALRAPITILNRHVGRGGGRERSGEGEAGFGEGRVMTP